MFQAAAFTDIGPRKKSNQDSSCVEIVMTAYGHVSLMAVCDGVGGLASGELASAAVVAWLVEWFRNALLQDLPSLAEGGEDAHGIVREAWSRGLVELNDAILGYGLERGMKLGTTCTALFLFRGRYLVAHVGDTRAYRFSEAGMELLTEDQTWVAREVALGSIAPEEVRSHPKRNVILQAVGAQRGLAPAFYEGRYGEGDAFMVCSDGFRNEISDDEMVRAFGGLQHARSSEIERVCENAARIAACRGEKDNITVAVLSCQGVDLLGSDGEDAGFSLSRSYAELPDARTGWAAVHGRMPGCLWARATDTRIGDVVGGRFRIVGMAGVGGMSVVWDARDTRMDVRRAIKEVRSGANTENYRANMGALKHEARLMKGLDHPLLPHVYDIVEERGRLYLVMEYIEGPDLLQVLQEHLQERGSPIGEDDVVRWGRQLCEALRYLHTSVADPVTGRQTCIVYRDMKPSNVKLREDGTVRVFDFGIAREFSGDKTRDTVLAVTHGYAPPEAYAKDEQTDPRSDVYSLGATLFHLATGHAPLEFAERRELPPVRSVNPSLSEGLEIIIARSTKLDRGERYQSCADMLAALENVEKLTEGEIGKKKGVVRRFRALAVASACCLALGAGGLAGSAAVRNSTVEGLVDRAREASVSSADGAASEAEELCVAAIEADPANTEPYLCLVTDVYPGDGSFGAEESMRWKEVFGANKSRISGSDGYAYLCYKAGLLYFNGYGSGYDVASGAEAEPFFEEAVSAYEERGARGEGYGERQNGLAKVYAAVGGFDRLLKEKLEEGLESEAWAAYWDAFEEGVEGVHAGDESALAQMRMYEVAFDAMNSVDSLTSFKRSGVSRSQAEDLLAKVRGYAAQVGPDGPEQTRDAYGQIVSEYETVMSKIAAVYANSGSGAAGASGASAASSSDVLSRAAGGDDAGRRLAR